ncbi:FAD-dependent oxidoreductase [soil metagenome]
MNDSTPVFWNHYAVAPKYAALAANIRVDVCIIGGGIAGLTAAYILQREGKTVCLLEAAELGSGESNKSTAHLTSALDVRYYDLEKWHGASGANLAAKSHGAAILKIESIVREEKIECELERLDGYLFATPGTDSAVLDRELAAAQRAGISGVTIVEKSTLPFFDVGRSLKFPGQMQIRPAPYEAALARAVSGNCGKIYTKTRVTKIDTSTEDVVTVTSESGFKVTSKFVVIATNQAYEPFFDLERKQDSYQTYVVGFPIRKGSVPRSLYWDTLDPYHYVRLSTISSEQDVLIIGGEDRPEASANHSPAYERLIAWTKERFPMVTECTYRWTGEILEPKDGLAFLGRDPNGKQNVFVISGESGNGITHATIGAVLISDQMLGRPNDWEEIYNPAREVRAEIKT